MRKTLFSAIRRSQYIIAGLVLASASLLIAGVNMLALPQIAQAASNCPYDPSFPNTNIAFCGVWQQNGANATLTQDISSLQNLYSTGTDSCQGAGTGNNGAQCSTVNDLTQVFNAFYSNAGSIIPSMKATDGNTLLAVSCGDGTLRTGSCSGTVLGTNMRIGARWNIPGNSDFQQIIGKVYTHSPSTFFSDDFSAVPTLVHISPSTGTVDFAIWLPCANVITVTPTKPKPVIVCDTLAANPVDGSATDYVFTAQGHAKYATIDTFTFDFGDHSTRRIVNAQPGSTAGTYFANIKYSYPQTTQEQTFTASVFVNDATTTPSTCQVKATIPPKQEQQPEFACKQLTAPATAALNTDATFTASATPDTTGIDHYEFDFGDGTGITKVMVSILTAQATHKYAQPGTYQIRVTIVSKTGQTSSPASCTGSVTVPGQPTALVSTGPGDVFGMFAAATTGGTLFHRFVLRKKFRA